MDKKNVLLFARAPVIGEVKTRIAKAIGQDEALDLYRNFLLDSVRTVERAACPLRICYHPREARDIIAGFLGERYEYMAQEGQDLGERMENAFIRIFSEGCTDALLIGSDIPDLSPSDIRKSFLELEKSDAVLGPASDGGYYLIGFRRETFMPDLFRGISWSTSGVLSDTISKARQCSLDIRLMRELNDIDSAADLKAFFKRTEKGCGHGSKTAEYLSRRKDLLDRIA